MELTKTDRIRKQLITEAATSEEFTELCRCSDMEVIRKYVRSLNGGWPCMSVTRVTIYKTFDERDEENCNSFESIMALASVVLNDQLLISGLKVCKNSLRGDMCVVKFPHDPLANGDEFPLSVSPQNAQLREHITNCVLEKYRSETEGDIRGRVSNCVLEKYRSETEGDIRGRVSNCVLEKYRSETEGDIRGRD